jgi:hypothetical protein
MVRVIESYVVTFMVVGDLAGGGLLEPASAISMMKSLEPFAGYWYSQRRPPPKTTALVVSQQMLEKK